MRILAIGDPHGDLAQVKKLVAKAKRGGAIHAIILTGDLGDSDALRTLTFQKTPATKAQWRNGILRNIRTAEKVVRFLAARAPTYTIYGNIEYSRAYIRQLEKTYGPLPKHDDLFARVTNLRVFNYRVVRIGALRVGGIPFYRDLAWAKSFAPKNKALRQLSERETARVEAALRRFGRVDILVCHAPPYGVRDVVRSAVVPSHWNGKSAGSKVIRSYIKRAKPSLVLCGHIHEGKGREQLGASTVHNLGHGGSLVIAR